MVAIKTYVDNLDPSLDSTKRLSSRRELGNMKQIERNLVNKGKSISLGNNQLRNCVRVATHDAPNIEIGENREVEFSEFQKTI